MRTGEMNSPEGESIGVVIVCLFARPAILCPLYPYLTPRFTSASLHELQPDQRVSKSFSATVILALKGR